LASFGRYEILDKLGEGAMGVVYRARDQSLGRIVALKMLSAELAAEDELYKRFQREAEAVGRLNHPNIVTVYDLGDAEGQLYMAMELLEGDDLRDLIDRSTPIPLAERSRILIEICKGLGYAHSKGVIHRDIKPANIHVTSGGRVKLLDFGLARVTTRSGITRRGMILGTPDYMSPEQAMGKELDQRTDIFSAGGVFYEFLTGQKPFKGKTLHSVLYQIISEDPEPVLTLSPELPARLAAVVHRMLHKDPQKRYASMGDAEADLRKIQASILRSHARSGAASASAPADETRLRARDLLDRARINCDSGQFAKAQAELHEALALDPELGEAASLMWRATKGLAKTRPPTSPLDPLTASRVGSLLEKAGSGGPESEVKQALAELALIAPDDPRVGDLVRERAGRRH
jgi:serine/threonine-protein kinase